MFLFDTSKNSVLQLSTKFGDPPRIALLHVLLTQVSFSALNESILTSGEGVNFTKIIMSSITDNSKADSFLAQMCKRKAASTVTQ